MEYLPHIVIACLLGVVALVALAWWNRNKVAAVTVDALLSAGQAAFDEADKLVAARRRAIAADTAALATEESDIAKARARLAGNASASA